MVIVNQANVWAGWQFDDHRAVFHIDNSRSIGRVGIEGESNLTRSGGSDADPFIVVDPDRAVAIENAFNRHRGKLRPKAIVIWELWPWVKTVIANIGVSEGAVGIHVLLTNSLFGVGIPRRLLRRVSPGKSTSGPLRY
jgi:hypothetical protein